MHDDILPPSRKRPNTSVQRQPMRSLRLRAQSPPPNSDEQPPKVEDTELPAAINISSKNDKPANPSLLPITRSPSINDEAETKTTKKRFGWIRNWHDWSRRKKILVAVGIVLILVLISGGVYALVHKDNPIASHKAAKKAAVAKVVAPTTVASPLSGLQVSPNQAKRSVTGVMIENSPDARPQSGLQSAGVIYEAIAEGGITRFLALFQDQNPQYVGPVRSARPYYLDWVLPFDASYVHVGGSPDALSQISSLHIKDLNQFYNADAFTRISSRVSPHNVYTSFDKLDTLNANKNFTTSKFTTFPRKADKKLATPTAKSIDLNISSAVFNVHYDYDAAANIYVRSEGGSPHMSTTSEADKVGGRLTPKVVVALVMTYSLADSAGHSSYATTGTGQMYVFQDGGVEQGTWSKADRSSQFSFADSTGHPLKLDAGQTWITAIGAASSVVYKP